MKKILIFCGVALILGGAAFFVRADFFGAKPQASAYKTSEEQDKFVRFGMEIFDKITANYWNKGGEGDLPELYRLAVEKTSSKPQTLLSKNRAGAAKLLFDAISALPNDEVKRKFVLDTEIVVLYNLAPQGRDGLLSSTQVKDLRDNVSNINPGKDLYGELGLSKGASQSEIDAAFSKKEQELKNSTSTEAQAQLKELAYAKDTLTDQNKKQMYDQAGIEPTVFVKTIGHTYYVDITKIAPTTLSEFGNDILATASSTKLNSLIIDMRSNIGGAVDFLQYFLGLFIGQGQYAYDFFHQGDYSPYKTMMQKLPELKKFRKIALLTDNMTQSTAELTAAAFKRYNLGLVIGTRTRGWGTIENTYPIDTEIDPNTKYSLLLVNSLTLRDDNQPIEGRGVDPDISISDKDWKKQLSNYYDSSEFPSVLQSVLAKPPQNK